MLTIELTVPSIYSSNDCMTVKSLPFCFSLVHAYKKTELGHIYPSISSPERSNIPPPLSASSLLLYVSQQSEAIGNAERAGAAERTARELGGRERDNAKT